MPRWGPSTAPRCTIASPRAASKPPLARSRISPRSYQPNASASVRSRPRPRWARSSERRLPQCGEMIPRLTTTLQERERMKRIIVAALIVAASAVLADAQTAKEPFEPGLGEFMTATQLRHAKLWFAGKNSNWDLAAYEIDEIKEGLEDAARLHATFDNVPVAEMIKSIIDPRIERLEKAVEAKSSAQF